MKLLTVLFVTTLLFTHPQESPELKEASDLTESVVKLFNQEKFNEALPLAKRALQIREALLPRTDYKRALTTYGQLTGGNTAEFQRASTGFACLGYESQNTSVLKELEEIQKQFVTEEPTKPVDVMNGRAISLAQPEYPAAARDLRLQGTVVVHVEIDEDGKVISAKDICQGLPYLSESAIRAALKSRFAPTKLSGVLVKVKGVIRYNFVNNGAIWRMNPTLP
jgi:TonB family protein